MKKLYIFDADGMVTHLVRSFHVFPEQAVFVGDCETDDHAAQAAGVDFTYANEFFGWQS